MRKMLFTVALMATLLISAAGVVEAETSGLKLADKLVYKAQQTTSAIRATNLQVKKTLESYNYIVQGKAEDPRKEYKKLAKDMDKSRASRDDVGVAAADMQKAADKYFLEWEESLGGYNSEDMRAKSEVQLNQTKENYAKIAEVGSRAGADFDGFIASMADQVRYLGQNLSPAAIAELTDEAAELNQQAKEFFTSIDATINEAVKYSASLQP